MAKIKYNADVMQYISIFESLTGAKARDCIINDGIMFIVEENEMGRAIGRHGSNIKRIENMLKKKIRLVEFNDDVKQFVRNMIYPIEAKEIREEEGIVNIYLGNAKSKGIVIGRDRHNINFISSVVKRHFGINEIKVA